MTGTNSESLVVMALFSLALLLQGNLFNEMRSKTKVLQKPITNFDAS